MKTARELNAELLKANRQAEQARQQATEANRRAAGLEKMLARYQSQFGSLDTDLEHP